MMKVIVRIFAVVGFLTVLLIGGAIGLAVVLGPDKPDLPKNIVLEFDFEQPLLERAPNDPFAGLFGGTPPTVQSVVDALDRAARDPRVKGMVAKVGNAAQGAGMTQELRDAVQRFRDSGRFAIVHAETFGEFSTGMQSYYLASAFDEVWLQPLGNVNITGILAAQPFARGTLEKLGVEPQIDKRADYKTAAELYMEKQASPANKEMTEALIGDLFDQMVEGIAEGRGLDQAAVRAAIDKAPLLDTQAVEEKLVDRIGYYDEAVSAAEEKARNGQGLPKTIDLTDYGNAAGPANDQGPAIAVVVGSGPISRGSGESSALSGEATFGAADVAEAIDKATADGRVKAIVFRVDSPGGSAVGSEVVRRSVQRARAAGKPVIISMGDLAASGGYWVSMGADRIVAQPATLTGSIGVLGGKMVTTGLTDWVGLDFTLTGRGANATIFSDKTPYSPSELDRRAAMLDDIYARFTGGVAEGRNMPIERVREIAKGRVYTGRQAKELGLVDALGGYATALELAREAIGLAPGAPVQTLLYPEPKSRYQQFVDLMEGDARVSLGRHLMADALADYRPILARIEPLLRSQGDQVLLMPPVGINGY